MTEPIWVLPEVVEDLHIEQLIQHGGSAGIRDRGLLESALQRPQHRFHYENATVFELAACYTFGIAKNHPFVDGNKRAAFIVAYVFLLRNGYRVEASQAEIITAVLMLAAGELPETGFARWLADRSIALQSAAGG
jgi:death on curing protein